VPEELVPVTPVGRLVLNRNPDNFFAETEQVAFCTAHVVPGIDFSNDPLLQGRLFSYLDTQLIRLGGPNFHQIPINQPVCPFRNLQRDGHMQTMVPKGQVNYEPNTINPEAPRECHSTGFESHKQPFPTGQSERVRARSESFGDHYSQARLFWVSNTPPEREHIAGAFAFELGKVSRPAIRSRMLAHLAIIHRDLAAKVSASLGMPIDPSLVTAFKQPKDLKPSPALSIVGKAPETLQGRKIGVLVTAGSDAAWLDGVRKAVKKEGAVINVVAPKVSGIKGSDGSEIAVDHALYAGPSILFDAVIMAPSEAGAKALMAEAAAVDWLRDAFGHLKVIGYNTAAEPLVEKAGLGTDEGVVALSGGGGLKAFIAAAKKHRIWAREKTLRSPED
jgi:catalase